MIAWLRLSLPQIHALPVNYSAIFSECWQARLLSCAVVVATITTILLGMFERRALERNEINQLALMCVDGIRGWHPCLVVNLHDGGATLRSSTYHAAASKFDLSLDGFKTTKRCRVVWRNGNTCGVEFLDQGAADGVVQAVL